VYAETGGFCCSSDGRSYFSSGAAASFVKSRTVFSGKSWNWAEETMGGMVHMFQALHVAILDNPLSNGIVFQSFFIITEHFAVDSVMPQCPKKVISG
jgi:hypothetical protein